MNHQQLLDLIDEMMFGFEPTKPYIEARRIVIRDRDAAAEVHDVHHDWPVVKDERHLPEAKPIPGRPTRSAPKSLDVKCPTCGAKPGAQCFKMTKPGKYGAPLPERRGSGQYHKPRIAAARKKAAAK